MLFYCFNRGIGLALAERLLQNDIDMHICLACRSMHKSDIARRALQTKFPAATITIVLIDISSMASIYQASQVIQSRLDNYGEFFFKQKIRNFIALIFIILSNYNQWQ